MNKAGFFYASICKNGFNKSGAISITSLLGLSIVFVELAYFSLILEIGESFFR